MMGPVEYTRLCTEQAQDIVGMKVRARLYQAPLFGECMKQAFKEVAFELDGQLVVAETSLPEWRRRALNLYLSKLDPALSGALIEAGVMRAAE
jgi:hypothetical protein